jgi:hypothetical protein
MDRRGLERSDDRLVGGRDRYLIERQSQEKSASATAISALGAHIPQDLTHVGYSPFLGARFASLFFVAAFLDRTSALLAAALRALCARSSGVIVSSERFPPFLPPTFPPRLPSLRKNSRTSGGNIVFAILMFSLQRLLASTID